MDPRHTADAELFRKRIRTFHDQNLPAGWKGIGALSDRAALIVDGRGPLRSYRTDDPGAANTSGSWLGTIYNAVAGTIYAGTSEVQRNIIGESVLGLPREPRI